MAVRRTSAAAQLSRLASESAAEPRRRAAPAASEAAARLEALRRNVGRIVMVPLTELHLGENVRRHVPTDTPEFQQLVDSIRKDGVLQNLIAELRETAGGGYLLSLVSGQRRYLAAERAGVENCPVRVVEYSDRASRVAHGLTENVLRDDLHCLDLAEGYADLLGEGWTEEQIAETFDRRRQTVMQFLRLARYPAEAKRVIREHAAEFTAYDLLNKFVARRWESEAALVAALRAHLAGRRKKAAGPKTDEALRRAGRELSARSGYGVAVSGGKKAGQITLRWASERQRAALFRLLEGLAGPKAEKG
jgi:ParB family transcriptional regulator, chromosome partitioning protein